VACPRRGGLTSAAERMQVPTLPFHVRDDRDRRRNASALQHDLAALIKQAAPHCVHANSLSMTRLLGGIAESCPVPCLGHLRDMMRISRASVDHLNRHDRLLAVSAAVKRWYVSQGVSAERIHVLHNGVDLEEFAPRAASGRLLRELSLPESSILLGAIGQIGMRKGLDVLLEALAPTMARRRDVHLVIVGQRYSQKDEAVRFEERLRQLANSPPLRGQVHFLGVRDDVSRLMNELDVLVHAARQEPLGRVLLEAAASGLATVATDVGGTNEIFPPGTQSAVLVAPDAPDELSQAIAAFIENPRFRERTGRLARRQAEQFFGAAMAADRLVGHYRDLRSRQRGTSESG
jgi:glycosyltransferase involved in cell wall biosynthesis